MAQRKQNSLPKSELARIPPNQGIELLRTAIIKAEYMIESSPFSFDEYSEWELLTRNCLEKAFGRFSSNVSAVMDVGKYGIIDEGIDNSYWQDLRLGSLKTQKAKLKGLVEVLQMEIQQDSGTSTSTTRSVSGHKIFLVHGHDEEKLNMIARFLERLKQDIIVLKEQPNMGRTVIEKFEDCAEEVGFAVILLTKDDRGGPASSQYIEQKFRARQNVIFELGYFIARLGRNRVCALYVEGVEIPSDYVGVLYEKIDASEGWKLKLARELKTAGLPMDMSLGL